MFAHNFGNCHIHQQIHSVLIVLYFIGNTTSNQVLSVMGFLWFSISHKINPKEKNPNKNKA